MFTAFNQSCPVYFIFSNLLLCKIIHIFNLIISFNFFINQVIKILPPNFFLRQKYKVILNLFYLHHHFHVYLLQKLSPFYTYSRKNYIFFDGIKYSIIFCCFLFNFFNYLIFILFCFSFCFYFSFLYFLFLNFLTL